MKFLSILLLMSTAALSAQEKPANVSTEYALTIDAPVEAVWATLAEDFGGIGKWASGVNASEGAGEGLRGAPHAERACKINAVGFSNARERILTYDETDHVLSYHVYEGVPGFVKNMVNTWTLTSDGNQTKLHVRTTMRAGGLMGWMMRGMMRGATQNVLQNMSEEVKHYVETGEPHPRKVKAQTKWNRKQVRRAR